MTVSFLFLCHIYLLISYDDLKDGLPQIKVIICLKMYLKTNDLTYI